VGFAVAVTACLEALPLVAAGVVGLLPVDVEVVGRGALIEAGGWSDGGRLSTEAGFDAAAVGASTGRFAL
jgi:hypothetical protein